MCEHCEALREVLTQLAGPKVATVIMRRAELRLHGTGSEEVSPNVVVVTA